MNDNFATRFDLESARNELTYKVETARAELSNEIKELRKDLTHNVEVLATQIQQSELRMTVRLGGLMTLTIGVVATLVKLL